MANYFPSSFFVGNRQKLYEQLKPDSLLVVTAWTAMQRSLDQAYSFEQEPNFWYLTGVDHADWMLLVDLDTRSEWLLAPYVAEVHQIFDGSFSPDEATAVSGIQTVLGKRQGAKILRELLAKKKRAYTVSPQDLRYYGFHANPAQKTLASKLKGTEVEDIRLPLTRQRAIKQPIELRAMQEAIDITVDGIKSVLGRLPGLKAEYEVDALLTVEFRRHKALHGFDPIVAAGHHATTLHYVENNGEFAPNDWLLMDVGARIHHYTADITRTIPLGKATDRQLELYESLRRDQQTITQLMQPDMDIQQFMERAEQVLYDSFVRLGLLKGAKKADRRALYKIMPHAFSHGLGYDTHDPLGRPEALHAGMVLTAEIGIYLPEERFGIRLEDDIVVTDTGPINMSGALPTSLAELGRL